MQVKVVGTIWGRDGDDDMNIFDIRTEFNSTSTYLISSTINNNKHYCGIYEGENVKIGYAKILREINHS